MKKRTLDPDATLAPTYAARAFGDGIPKYRLPDAGLDAQAAYQLVHDELALDGNPVLNLASFVTTWMEPQADQLGVETQSKNLIDQDEYPQTEAIHRRVVSMIGDLFHAPSSGQAVGTATIGSSEAIMLGMLAHKRSWQHRRRAAGEPTERPNMVLGADVHTCWEKFARYFEVEPRVIPMEEGRYTIAAEHVEPLIDERTIGVAGVLATTFTGGMDDLRSINDMLARVERDRGLRVPMHIDAATGGFILPFSEPDEAWDFRLSHVRSINVSNHKFGLVYPGMGTVVFRDSADLPEELVFHINYLGGDMPNYTLNFSRPAYGVILQYFSFVRLGHEGYRRVITTALENARALAAKLAKIEGLELIEGGSRFPIVVARTTPGGPNVDLRVLSRRLRERGWILPAYTLPPNADHITVLRMVIKENVSRDMVELLAADVRSAFEDLAHEAHAGPQRPRTRRRPHC